MLENKLLGIEMDLNHTDSDDKIIGDDKRRKYDNWIEQFGVFDFVCVVDHKKVCKPDNNNSYNNG